MDLAEYRGYVFVRGEFKGMERGFGGFVGFAQILRIRSWENLRSAVRVSLVLNECEKESA